MKWLCSVAIIFAPSFGVAMNSRDIIYDDVWNIPVADAWSYWTSNQRLETWLTVKANVQPKIGGAYELFWNPQTPNENSTIGCKITTIVPNKLLAFEWKGAVPFADIMNVEPLPTWASVSFENVSPSQTAIHFRHTGWSDSAHWQEARKWQQGAWNGAFQEIKKILTH